VSLQKEERRSPDRHVHGDRQKGKQRKLPSRGGVASHEEARGEGGGEQLVIFQSHDSRYGKISGAESLSHRTKKKSFRREKG